VVGIVVVMSGGSRSWPRAAFGLPQRFGNFSDAGRSRTPLSDNMGHTVGALFGSCCSTSLIAHAVGLATTYTLGYTWASGTRCTGRFSKRMFYVGYALLLAVAARLFSPDNVLAC